MNTFKLEFYIDAHATMINDTVWIKLSPSKAFGPNRFDTKEELMNEFNKRLNRDKKLIKNISLKNTNHYTYYMDYDPYMRVCYDIFTDKDGRIYFMDYESYIEELYKINEYLENPIEDIFK